MNTVFKTIPVLHTENPGIIFVVFIVKLNLFIFSSKEFKWLYLLNFRMIVTGTWSIFNLQKYMLIYSMPSFPFREIDCSFELYYVRFNIVNQEFNLTCQKWTIQCKYVFIKKNLNTHWINRIKTNKNGMHIVIMENGLNQKWICWNYYVLKNKCWRSYESS